MFLGNGRRPQHSHSPNASEASVNHAIQNVWPARSMGPPQLNHLPQPVEIDPVSYPRNPSSYTSWESTAYSVGYIGDLNPSVSNPTGHNKSSPMSVDFGARQDPLTHWYTGNDGPWIPKGAFPEVSHDERSHHRGYGPYRNPGYGSSPRVRHRPGNPSENGSVHYGISSSDSGYGTGISLESASVRGSDIVDHSQDNRNLLGRVADTNQYRETRSSRGSHGSESWPYSSPSATSYRCPTCCELVKTKSVLKKHHLRHTKPFRCNNASCSRTEGFSTVNDLNRHKQSKHPDDFSGEIRLKKYHCLVSGCKSYEKIWPRLDNFRSHLKRMHHLRDDAMDQFVHRGEVDQGTNCSVPSQGTSSASPGGLDQDIQLGLGSDDFPELSYPADHPQWSNVSSSPLNRQAEITDPLLENPDEQILAPPNGDGPIGLNDGLGKPVGLRENIDSWESDAGNGCLEKEKEVTSADAPNENIAVPIAEPLGSSLGSVESSDTLERGKTPKPKKSSSIDPCLREALITAVFSTVNPGMDDGSEPSVKCLPGIGSPDRAQVSEITPSRMDSRTALPSDAATSRRHSNNPDPCLKSSSASMSDKKHLPDQDAKIQEILQVIRDAGYVLKKENKSHTGLGQNVNNLASGAHKKRDPVQCSLCRFRGRPCELKKHMKRHTRPYGCTVSKCHKTFGSKNDWRRHETSQHYQHESWRCDEKSNGTSCAKIIFSAEIARTHLTKMHNITDPEVMEQKITARRIGANNQARFWCGFCERIVDQTQKGVDGWTERFNHIEDHFIGRNDQTKKSIAEWKAADSGGEGILQNASPQPLSPRVGDEAPEDLTSSSDNSSSLPDTSTVPASPGIVSAHQKRKRDGSDKLGGRTKQARRGKYELRIECCECGFNLNPRTDTACPEGHDICDSCPRKKVMVQDDNAER